MASTKTTAVAVAPKRRRKATPKTIVKYRTKTKQVVRKVLDRAKLEAVQEKEALTAVAVAGVLGFAEAKMDMSKLPEFMQKMGLPLTVGALAFLIQKLNLGGSKIKSYMRPIAMSGISIGIYEYAKTAGTKISGYPTTAYQQVPEVNGVSDSYMPPSISGMVEDEEQE